MMFGRASGGYGSFMLPNTPPVQQHQQRRYISPHRRSTNATAASAAGMLVGGHHQYYDVDLNDRRAQQQHQQQRLFLHRLSQYQQAGIPPPIPPPPPPPPLPPALPPPPPELVANLPPGFPTNWASIWAAYHHDREAIEHLQQQQAAIYGRWPSLRSVSTLSAERLNLFLHADGGDAEDISMPSDFLPNNLAALSSARRAALGDGADETQFPGAARFGFSAGQGVALRRATLAAQQAAGGSPRNADGSKKKDWKQRAKIVLPHVGLVLMSILYTVLGAVIFYAIERPYEVDQKRHSLDAIIRFRQDFASKLWSLSRNASTDLEIWTDLVDKDLEGFMHSLRVAFIDHHVTMDDIQKNLTEDAVKWTFSASLFFSATVITTIGYGHLVPQTPTGQIVCIGFALIGIPLILVTIADMGKFLSSYVIKIYHFYSKTSRRMKRCCSKCFHRLQRRRLAWLARRAAAGKKDPLKGDANHNNAGGNNMDDDTQQVPGTSAAAASVLDDDSSSSSESSVDGPNPDDPFAEGEPVSATFLLIILVGYTALGAALFPLWERGEEWTYFGAFYYCFITVTTIGFGDLVPENQSFILATITYIVLGLIITTMCIDLVGSTYIRDLHFFGRMTKQMLQRQALIQFGGKVVNLSDVFGYVAFLQRSFGVTAEQIGQMAMLPEEYLLECLVHGRQPNIRYFSGAKPFIPNDIYYIKWIEQPRTLSYTSEKVLASLESLDVTSRCSTVRTPREWYYHMIMEHMKDTKV